MAQETKYTVVWGTAWRRDELELTLDSYAAWVDDFILPTTIAREDVNGDGSEDRVRGFHSVEATLLGGEAGIVPRLTRELSVPTSFAVVYGQNETDGRPLPEIPPWELRTALRADFAMAFPWWAEVGARWDGKQTRVDEAFGEDATPAFIVAHLRAGATILDHFELAGAIENLLDAEYHEHLTREAVFAQGGLTQNGEIPAPGRSAHARVRAWLP